MTTKIIKVLQFLYDKKTHMSVTEISEKMNLSYSQVHRAIRRLQTFDNVKKIKISNNYRVRGEPSVFYQVNPVPSRLKQIGGMLKKYREREYEARE